MIINLVGPPAAGKSTFAARFVLEHPKYRFCPIDEYRLKFEDEVRSWSEMMKDVLARRHTVIESCGMSWRLGDLLNTATLRRRPLLTIAFTGERSILLERLKIRQKRPLPEPYLPEDELMALDFALEHFDREVEARVNRSIVTTNHTKDEVYEEVSDFIHTAALYQNGQPYFRRESFPTSAPRKRSEQYKRALGL